MGAAVILRPVQFAVEKHERFRIPSEDELAHEIQKLVGDSAQESRTIADAPAASIS